MSFNCEGHGIFEQSVVSIRSSAAGEYRRSHRESLIYSSNAVAISKQVSNQPCAHLASQFLVESCEADRRLLQAAAYALRKSGNFLPHQHVLLVKKECAWRYDPGILIVADDTAAAKGQQGVFRARSVSTSGRWLAVASSKLPLTQKQPDGRGALAAGKVADLRC